MKNQCTIYIFVLSICLNEEELARRWWELKNLKQVLQFCLDVIGLLNVCQTIHTETTWLSTHVLFLIETTFLKNSFGNLVNREKLKNKTSISVGQTKQTIILISSEKALEKEVGQNPPSKLLHYVSVKREAMLEDKEITLQH